jgi:hypothetical protein
MTGNMRARAISFILTTKFKIIKRIMLFSRVIFILVVLVFLISGCESKVTKPGKVWKDPYLGMEFVWVL